MSSHQTITRDPTYYITAAFFALLTTALPAIMGQPRFMPISQALALTIFVAMALHGRNLRGALNVMALWLAIQFVTITLLGYLFGPRIENAFADGFDYRGAITSWYLGGGPLPAGIASQPLGRLAEFAGIILGSLATAGLAGTWFLMRLVNQSAFGTGILLEFVDNIGQIFLVLPYWTLLRIAGYAGLSVLCAKPLLTNNWSPGYYWQHHRRLLTLSLALLLLGLLLELFLPGIVSRTPVT